MAYTIRIKEYVERSWTLDNYRGRDSESRGPSFAQEVKCVRNHGTRRHRRKTLEYSSEKKNKAII